MQSPTPIPPSSGEKEKERKSVRPSLIEPAPLGLPWALTQEGPRFVSARKPTMIEAPNAGANVDATKRAPRDVGLLGPIVFAAVLVLLAIVSPYLPGVPH